MTAPAGSPIVLIADDSEDNVELLHDTLEDDYIIVTAYDGQACLQRARQQPQPNLIFLDIDMPDMNGFEVCEHLKANHDTASIPVIFLTGMLNEADEQRGLQLGAVDYITKPFSLAIVQTRLKTHLTQQKLNEKLAKMASYDQLTGLYNRHHFLELLDHIDNHRWAPKHFGMMLIDIDHFKQANDNKGHLFGDNVLRAIAQIVQNNIRREDIACRWGGEELLVLLENCSIGDACTQAEEIRQNIENLRPEGYTITASIGVSEWNADKENIDAAISLADCALYKAKDMGRNRVKMCDH